MTIGDLLAEQGRLRPDAVALIDARDNCRYTFRELDRAVSRAAAWWQDQGIARGDAALVFVPMSADLYIALLGLFRIGAVALFLDPSSGKDHLERCCDRWAPKALFAIPKAHLLRLKSKALRAIPLKIAVGGWFPFAKRWALEEYKSQQSSALVNTDDPALVTFTSGSTGIPKATVRTHEFLIAQYKALAPSLHLHAGDVDLATLPIFVLANLAAGVTTILPDVDLRRPGEVDPTKLFAHVRDHQVTRITASPALFERMIAHGEKQGVGLPSLRQLHTGGAPVFPRVLDALARLAPCAEVVAVYGSTEAEPIAHLARGDITGDDRNAMTAGQGLLAGTPTKEITLAILPDLFGKPIGPYTADEFAEAQIPPNVIGEIVVTGDHVLKGYLGGLGDEETKFRVGEQVWHRTGDSGSIDDQGRLWLSGRCSAKTQVGARTLYPLSIEAIAMTFPEVTRAAFTGHRGKPVLVVEARTSTTLETAVTKAVQGAGIEGVLFVDKIPVDRRHNAKIDYPSLRILLEKKLS